MLNKDYHACIIYSIFNKNYFWFNSKYYFQAIYDLFMTRILLSDFERLNTTYTTLTQCDGKEQTKIKHFTKFKVYEILTCLSNYQNIFRPTTLL